MLNFKNARPNLNLSFLFAIVLMVVPAIACAGTSFNDPQKKVEEITETLIARLTEASEQLEKDPDYVQTIVSYLILPHVDFRKLTATTLGSYWQQISEGERRCLTIGVRERVVARYAGVLLESAYHDVETDPVATPAADGTVVVSQTVKAPDPGPLKVKYKLEQIDGDWKIVDLIVAEVSLSASYQVSFREEIDKQGIGDFLRMFPACRER